MAADLFTMPSLVLDTNADPYSGALAYFYATGTTTPQSVYTSAALSVAHANPVVADSAGKLPTIYMDPSLTYRCVIKNSTGSVTLHDIDPINTGLTSLLAANDGAELVTFKSTITGSKTRNMRAKVGETHVDALDFASPDDSAAAQTSGLAAMFANAAAGANIHFPNEGTYKTNSRITVAKQFNIHGNGSQIWGQEGDANKATLEIAVSSPSNGNGDVRRMLIDRLDVISVDVSTGATGPAIKVTSPIGLLQFMAQGCYFGTNLTTAYAAVLQSDIFAISSGDEQFQSTLRDCTIFNGLHLNKISDAFGSLECTYLGTKRNRVDVTEGAFRTVFRDKSAQASEGYLHIIAGSQIDIDGTQIEGNASSGAAIEVDASTYDMGQILMRRVNFGSGPAKHVILKGSKNLSQVEFDGCTWGLPTTYDIDIQASTVRDTIIRRNQFARTDRMATGFAPNNASYAAAEAAKTGSHDMVDLMLINDSGTGTRGIWKTGGTYSNGWSSNGHKFMKCPVSGMVFNRGAWAGGTTTNGTTIYQYPEGFRTLEDAYAFLPTTSGTTPCQIATNSAGSVVIIGGGATALVPGGGAFSFYAPNSRYLPGV